MKLDRLVSIITVLLRRERVPARELADMFEVSVRTILRDVDAINMAGIPIVTYQGSGGGIGIAEGYKLDRSVLTGDEMAALIMSLNGFASSLGDPKLGILLDKIRNTIPQSQLATVDLKSSQIHVDLTPWGGSSRLKADLELLRRSIEQQREVAFTYIDSDGRRTERAVQPYTLVLKGQGWYLYGLCGLRKAFRLFKVIRMRGLRQTGAAFVRMELPAMMPEAESSEGDRRTIADLLLRFDLAAENYALEWFGEGSIEYREDAIYVRVFMPENNWLYGWLLGFGPALEIMEPQHIREIVAGMAGDVCRKYGDAGAQREATARVVEAEHGEAGIADADGTAFSLRPASPADVPVLAGMNLNLIRDEGSDNPMGLTELERRMLGFLNGAYHGVLILVGGEAAGYCLYRHEEGPYGGRPGVYLRQYYIRPEYRRLRLGTRALERIAAEHFAGAAFVELDVLDCNAAGRAFWASAGFRPVYHRMKKDLQT